MEKNSKPDILIAAVIRSGFHKASKFFFIFLYFFLVRSISVFFFFLPLVFLHAKRIFFSDNEFGHGEMFLRDSI